MARRKVIEILCDRCGRRETFTEHQLPSEENGKLLSLSLWNGDDSLSVEFADLCRRCRRAVSNYVRAIAKLTDDEAKENETGEASSG